MKLFYQYKTVIDIVLPSASPTPQKKKIKKLFYNLF